MEQKEAGEGVVLNKSPLGRKKNKAPAWGGVGTTSQRAKWLGWLLLREQSLSFPPGASALGAHHGGLGWPLSWPVLPVTDDQGPPSTSL